MNEKLWENSWRHNTSCIVDIQNSPVILSRSNKDKGKRPYSQLHVFESDPSKFYGL